MLNSFSLHVRGTIRSLTIVCMLSSACSAWGGTLTPSLSEALRTAPPGQEFAVIVRLKDKVNHAQLAVNLTGRDRKSRLAKVIRTLKDKAEHSQQDILRSLKERERAGSVKGTKFFWIFNGVALTATATDVRELASREDVDTVVLDRIVTLGTTAAVPAAYTSTWNLSQIGAPTLWSQGFRGQGVVVANMDSGVDISHPALAMKWRGGTNSWFDPYRNTTTPYDRDGHGTGTMGIMVGGNTSDNQVGVAPSATWIAAKIFDDQGNATLSAIHAAFQWMLNPDGNPSSSDAPDVVNNSWDIVGLNGEGTGQYNPEFQGDIDSLRAAGIAVVFAAGNEGTPVPPQTNTSTSPGNNQGAFAVGATDSNDVIAYFSSRGPSAFDGTTIYPAIVAPGVNIRTTDLNGTYSMYTNLGTSFSAPHISGAIALLLSGRPAALTGNPDALENALKATARDLGAAGPDNTYGYGRLDVAGAASLLALPTPPGPTGDVNGDGVVDMQDALIVLQAAVGAIPVTPAIMQQGDVAPLVNGAPQPDGIVNVLDALAILRKGVGLLNF